MSTTAQATALTTAELDQSVTVPPERAFATLGVGRTVGYALLKNGTIPSIRVGKRYVIPADAFRRFLSA